MELKYTVSQYYCMPKESWPILYSKLQNNLGKNFLDRQFIIKISI